ncbi:hypothetical protein TNCV_1337371 [Trichonephila clavipes]|nr:hypothetical protein TNCV_1337371 [Trichonephila clavipes]
MRDSSVKTTSFHSATHILLSSHHWWWRRLWFCVKGRPCNGRLPDRPLCCKRRRMFLGNRGRQKVDSFQSWQRIEMTTSQLNETTSNPPILVCLEKTGNEMTIINSVSGIVQTGTISSRCTLIFHNSRAPERAGGQVRCSHLNPGKEAASPGLITLLSILHYRHSSCRAVFRLKRVAGGGKREDTARPRASKRFSMGLRSGEYAGHAMRTILSLSR